VADQRANSLIAINTAFTQRNVALNFPTYQATQSALAVAALNPTDLAHFQTFVQQRPCTVDLFLDLMAQCGAHRADGLQAMCFAVQSPPANTLAARLGGFTVQSMGAICQAARLFPLHGGFTGFRMWGTGDALPEDEDEAKLVPRDDDATRQKNLRWHFMKHVLSIAKDGSSAVPDESAWWFQKLGIVIRRSDLTKLTPQREAEIAHVFHNGVLMQSYTAAFLGTGILAENGSLVGRLVSQYETAYGTLALTQSVTMQRVAVLVSNQKVMISGCTDDDLYLIGRVEANGIVGLSSCYMASDLAEKLRGRKQVMLWEVTTDFA
jgi:hypothetical protein